MWMFLDRAAAPLTPEEANGAAAATRLDHDDGRTLDDDGFAIGNASLIGTAMETAAATLGGIGNAKAKACDGACNHNCCEKILHVFSLYIGPARRCLSDHPV
jgi:hypothetical protein